MLKPEYPIFTERLALRPPVVADAAALAVYKSQADVVRYVPYDPLTVEQITQRLAKARTFLDDEGQALPLLVHHRATGELLGDIVLFWLNREHGAGEIGYIFDPAHAGHGYATEASRVLLGLGFDELGLHRIVGRIDARNTASARVLERLGLRREAHFVGNEWFKGEWVDEVVYAMLADEWAAQRADS
jgi:RimJ/RimL family protein N-acetyltransferase